jgi:hypothetical protein
MRATSRQFSTSSLRASIITGASTRSASLTRSEQLDEQLLEPSVDLSNDTGGWLAAPRYRTQVIDGPRPVNPP